jgi:hypothetical protein
VPVACCAGDGVLPDSRSCSAGETTHRRGVMAVSRRKMLGHYSRGPGGYKCPCCKEPGFTTRWRKTVERREVLAEIEEEVRELTVLGRPSPGPVAGSRE